MKRDTIIEIALLIFTAAILILFIFFGLSTVSGAEDYELYGAGYDSAQVEITYTEPSTYVVLIPASIDMSDGASYTFTASYINITDDEMVVVNASNLDAQNCLQLTNGTKTIKKRFVRSDVGYGVDQNCAAVFDGNGTTSLVWFYFENPENEAIPKAGYYTGTISFDVFVTGRG